MQNEFSTPITHRQNNTSINPFANPANKAILVIRLVLAVILGCIERPEDRGGHMVYASLVYIDAAGTIQSIHRQLMPTYEERQTWAAGDGYGLRTHRLAIIANTSGFLADGGSSIAGPDGTWIAPPVVEKEELIQATLDHRRVLE